MDSHIHLIILDEKQAVYDLAVAGWIRKQIFKKTLITDAINYKNLERSVIINDVHRIIARVTDSKEDVVLGTRTYTSFDDALEEIAHAFILIDFENLNRIPEKVRKDAIKYYLIQREQPPSQVTSLGDNLGFHKCLEGTPLGDGEFEIVTFENALI